LYYLCR